jgi:hypothetical protein
VELLSRLERSGFSHAIAFLGLLRLRTSAGLIWRSGVIEILSRQLCGVTTLTQHGGERSREEAEAAFRLRSLSAFRVQLSGESAYVRTKPARDSR